MTLTELYNYLENKHDLDSFDLPDYTFVKQDQILANLEKWAFFNIDAILDSIEIQENKTSVIEYFSKRITETKNIYLLSRYFHLLYLFNHKKELCEKAILNYKLIISKLSINSSNAYDCYEVFILVLSLSSVQKKLIISEIKPMLTNLTQNGNDDLKYWLVQIIAESKLDSNTEKEFIPNLCKELAVSNYNMCHNMATTGLQIAKKNAKKFKPLISKFYEILGDNEEKNIRDIKGQEDNIAIPHQNNHTYKIMMRYYKNGNCDEKYNNTMKVYNLNKCNLQFIRTPIYAKTTPELHMLMTKYYQQIIGMNTKLFLIAILVDNHLIFPSDEKLNNIISNRYNYFSENFIEHIKVDLYGNEIPMDENYQKFQIIDICLNQSIHFILSCILSAVKSKKITYAKIKHFLTKSTSFGVKLPFQRNNLEFSYSWFEQIDYALKNLFKQLNQYVQVKEADWRLVIDVLPTKFEGILRDMIKLQNGIITKIGKDGKTSDALLDDLLRERTFTKIFNEDDKNLFEYVFTNKGLNIRNYAAHGFYKPQDYTLEKAILVFMCIMRLTKYNP